MGFGPEDETTAGTLCRLLRAGVIGMSVATLGLAPARAEQPDPPHAVPVTADAGMGTDDAPRPGSATDLPLTTPLPPLATSTAQTHSTAPATPPAAAPASAPQASAPAPVRGGVDAAGDGAAATASAPETAPPAAPPAPVVAESPLAPIAGSIASLLATPDHLGVAKKEQDALVTFYGARQNMPVFVDDKGVDARGKAVIARLGAAAEDGLDPADYAVPAPRAAADASELARTELKLAVAALTYARHAQSGRFDPNRISALVTPVRDIPDPTAILTKVAYAPDANAALASYNPPHAGYKALKAQLAKVTGQTTPGIVAIASGPQIRPGASDARIPALRARLGLTTGVPGDLVYDRQLADAVKAYQETVSIKPTGIVGPSTLAALNEGANPGGGSLKADVIANMERWRWLPRDLGQTYVMVNIPEFMVRIFEDTRRIHETRVVVGKPQTPTPLLTREMQYIVVNPAWNIPPSIARNEMMPLLRSDPSALSRRGIQVVRNGSGGYSFRQAPSERNALGRIKFMFPNDHSVYLHDTPSKALFQNDRRAYSHGCVRVYEPLKFGEVIFNLGLPGDNWTEGRISKMFGSSERYINLKQRFPVHIVYFNVVFDDAGRLVTREDLYGINADVKTRLGLDGRKRIAEGGSASAPKPR